MKITTIDYNQKTQKANNTKTNLAFGTGSIQVKYFDLEFFDKKKVVNKKEIRALKTIMQKILKNKTVKDTVKKADCDIELDATANCFDGDMFYVGMGKPHDFGLPLHDRKAYVFNAIEIVKDENAIKNIAENVVDIIKLHTGLRKPTSSEWYSDTRRFD